MIAPLVFAAILALKYAESIPADHLLQAFPVYTHIRSTESGIVPQVKQLLHHFQQSQLQPQPQPQSQPQPQPQPQLQPQPQPQLQPQPQPQPQPQLLPDPQPDPVEPFESRRIPANPEPFDPYGARRHYPDPPESRAQPQPESQPVPDQTAPEPHRGFSIEDIERKPIFVFTTTDDKSYDIVYALSGISGLTLDPATKYIADYLLSNDTEKLVVVFSYQNFPFAKLPNLPIARLILPNDLKLSFFDLENLNKPIVAIFTKQQLNALDSFVQNTHVSLIGQIKLPKPASSSRTRSIHGVNYVL